MFWKKKEQVAVKAAVPAGVATEASSVPAAPAKVKPAKVKKLSPREILEAKILALQPEEAISYKLADIFGGGLAVAMLNPNYPAKGRKFALLTETLVNGKPSGKRKYLWDYNKSIDIAKWILERNGTPYENTATIPVTAAGS